MINNEINKNKKLFEVDKIINKLTEGQILALNYMDDDEAKDYL